MKMPTSKGGHSITPAIHRGMYMGESDSTDRNRQNLCDWILGFRASEVKKKRPTSEYEAIAIIPEELAY